MQIMVRAAIGAQVTSVPIEVDPKWVIKSVIVEFCQKIDIPVTGDIEMKDDSGLILNKSATIGEAGIHNGDTVFISHSEPEGDAEQQDVFVRRGMERSQMYSIVLVCVGFVLVTASICGIIALAMRFTEEICSDEGYGAVFDAGSSHTNLTIYSWLGDSRTEGTGVVRQEGTCRSPGGGISSYDDNPQDAGPSLISCLDYTKQVVPEQYYNFTSLHLGATAGMRLLEKTEPSTSTLIMESVRQTMATYPFNFTANQATIISGSDEGSYGWVSANFLSGTLNPGSTLSSAIVSALSADPLPTVGALDMGGASTQITFIPEDPSSLPPQYSENLRLYGVNYTLYTHSYLCYGVNEAIRRFKANLVKDSGYAKMTVNPCAPKGFRETVDGKYLWEAPCSKGPQALAGWGSEVLPSPNAVNITSFNLSGTSDLDSCRTAVAKLFNFTAPCPIEPCSFNGVYHPKPYGKFLAFSVFANLISDLDLPSDASVQHIENTTKSFCAKTYDEVKKMPGNLQLLVLYCFDLTYFSTLLLRGYKFDADIWKITFTNEVKGKELGWSLGFMINATNMIPTEASCTDFTKVGFYVGLAILIVTFVIGLIVLVIAVYRCTRPKRESGYEELNPDFARKNTYGSL
ncbi:ectonucleoside triphosphate diphosphohydrolase 2-like [Acanthaster planci]|uniref:Ectonucleoside triphosphate diphosphohydrolase 2-like n=1 Tax=Acanthaster planci TaxID=133434 RepID=A0A8B7YYD6_ACAPL|nr:ectonucleoside triphosphate diphosphohydrolase 2-like [Acanthaster planci]